MFAFFAAGRRAAAVRLAARRSALAVAALAAASPALAAPLGGGALSADALVREVQWFGIRIAPEEIADILYTRYGMQRVMRIRSMGDVYEADAIDRRGYRVHVTLDGASGRMLESFVVGGRAYEAPVPTPPRGVPGGIYREREYRETYRYPDAAPLPQDERIERRNLGPAPSPDTLNRERAKPPRSREARTPDATTAPAAPRKPKAVPNQPKPAEQAAPAVEKPAPEKPASTAARPAAPEPEAAKPVVPAPMPAPAPTTTPPVTQPEKPTAEEPAAPPVRQAAPAIQRTPEPLVDPKTGQPTGAAGAVPIAPLDDSSSKAPSAPTPAVPPAALD